ncbi:MAG: hypothetical protein OCD00_04210, partial [Colwellia sp.]
MHLINDNDDITIKLGVNYITSSFVKSLITIGLMGWFAPLLITIKLSEWIPNSLEWPVGTSDNAIILKNNRYVIGHEPTNRIQFYDKNLEFEHGFFVNSASKGIRVISNDSDNFYVYQFSGNILYHFDYDGNLIEKGKYLDKDYPNKGSLEVTIPNSIILEPFTSPVKAWLLILLIGVGSFLVAKPWKSKTNKKLN